MGGLALVSESGFLRFSQVVVEDLPILFYVLRHVL